MTTGLRKQLAKNDLRGDQQFPFHHAYVVLSEVQGTANEHFFHEKRHSVFIENKLHIYNTCLLKLIVTTIYN